MLEKIKTEVDRLLLCFKSEKNSILSKSIDIFFSFSKPKVVYLRLILPFLSFPKFWKQNFMYFGRKHAETEPSRAH